MLIINVPVSQHPFLSCSHKFRSFSEKGRQHSSRYCWKKDCYFYCWGIGILSPSESFYVFVVISFKLSAYSVVRISLYKLLFFTLLSSNVYLQVCIRAFLYSRSQYQNVGMCAYAHLHCTQVLYNSIVYSLCG